MKSIKFIKREAINWFIILAPIFYILLVYNRMPQFAPFQINSEQTIYQVLLFIMGVSIFWYIFLLVKPSIVPKTAFHDNLKNFQHLHRFYP
jgi:hypothetical protein